MKKLAAILTLVLMFSGLAIPQTPPPDQILSTFVAKASSWATVDLVPNSTDMSFNTLTVYAGTPSVGCDTLVQLMDWHTGAMSYFVYLGAGGTSSFQTIVFTVPAGDNVAVVVSTTGTCTTPAANLNIHALYH